MKKLFLFAAALLMAGHTFATLPPAVKLLKVEPNHSTLQFALPISGGMTRITGKYTDFTIEMDLAEGDLPLRVETVIQAKSINTGIPGRDEHLCGADFFDVEQFPEITFRSDSIEEVESGFVAHGTFTMHGVSKPMALAFQSTGKEGNYTYGYTTRLSLNRIDYGVGANWAHTSEDNFLGEEVQVEIDFWTKKRKE